MSGVHINLSLRTMHISIYIKNHIQELKYKMTSNFADFGWFLFLFVRLSQKE